jgi:FAD/FMN-containing dehydrogenase
MMILLFLLLLVASVTDAWTDWDKRQTCNPSNGFHQPSSVAELVQLVQVASFTQVQVKVVGSGHSFSQITLTDDGRRNGSVMLNLDQLDAVIKLPTPEDLSITVEAGIRVHVLNDKLLQAGYALLNTGAIAQQSIAGATQTGTHGTGSKLGSMSSQLLSIDLLLANGTIVTASMDENVDIFHAARVGLGALGIVVRATLTVVPNFKLHRVAMPYPLDKLMLDLPKLNEQYDRLQWYWTPFTNNATLLLRSIVPVDTEIVPCWPGAVEKSINTGSNVTCTDWSFKALCHEADDAVLYTEMEMFVDRKYCMNLVTDFQKYQTEVRNQSQCAGTIPKTGKCSLFTGIRYGRKDEISWMSPMYDTDICVLSNIVLGTTEISGPQDEFALFGKQLEKIAFKYGGRPHWGKMNYATSNDIQSVYPMLNKFKHVRDQLDPGNMFLNNYLRRVLGISSE